MSIILGDPSQDSQSLMPQHYGTYMPMGLLRTQNYGDEFQTRDKVGYGDANRWPIGKTRLPRFNLATSGFTVRRLNKNEQSGYNTATMAADRAVKTTIGMAKRSNVELKSARGFNWIPSFINSRRFTPGSAVSLLGNVMPVPAAVSMSMGYGAGLTPTSPFIYKSVGGVPKAQVTGIRSPPSPISGRILIRQQPVNRQTLKGE